MNRPEGYESVAHGPHCGVLAVAVMAGVDFYTAWDVVKGAGRKGPNWRGRTYDHDRRRALDILSADYVERRHWRGGVNPIFGDPNDLPRCTVATFAKKYAKPATTYMLTVGGHVVTLRDGVVQDQTGIKPVGAHGSRRQLVRLSTEIVGSLD